MKELRNYVIAIIAFGFGVLSVFITHAWDNPTASYSGSMSVLSNNGNISVSQDAIFYTKSVNTFSIQELEALAKMAQTKEGMYVITPCE